MKKFVIPFLILAFFSFKSHSQSSSDKELQLLRDTDKNWAATCESKDVNRMLSFYDEEAFFVQNPPVRGKDSLRELWGKYFSLPDYLLTWQVEDARISESEDLAYTSGPWQQQWTKDGKLIKSTGRYPNLGTTNIGASELGGFERLP